MKTQIWSHDQHWREIKKHRKSHSEVLPDLGQQIALISLMTKIEPLLQTNLKAPVRLKVNPRR
jgi:hypothetical protein